MKILVLSDAHGRVGNVLDAVERERPDRVFYLGDLVKDTEELQWLYPSLTVHAVAGNCDGFDGGLSEMELTLGGKKFLLTHGHRYRAKLGTGKLLQTGRDRQVDAVCFGHTHSALARQEPDGLWLINPGTVGGVGAGASYGVITVEDGQLSVEIKKL